MLRKRNRNKYLGKRVKDKGDKGLDKVSEVETICKEIIKDYKKKRISFVKAQRRLIFLKLIVKRNKKMSLKEKQKSIKIIEEYLNSLRKMKK